MTYIHICYKLSTGGILSFIKYILSLNSVSTTQHDILILIDDNMLRPETFPRARVHTIKERKINFLKLIRKTSSIVKKYDALLLHSVHPIILAAIIFLRKKVLIFQHGLTFNSKNLLIIIIKKLWYSVTPVLLNARVICSTSFAKAKLKGRGIWFPNSFIKVVPFGIILPSNISSHRRPFDIKKEIRVGVAANLVKEKRVDLILKSFEEYKGETRYVVYIAGNGPEMSKLRKMANRIEIDRVKINFLGWVSDMNSFYKNIDVFVLPSKAESFGFVIAESLSWGVPVIVFSDVGGGLSLLSHMYNGFILKDVNELKELWHKISNDPEILNRQYENIRNMDFSNLNMKITRREIEKLLSEDYRNGLYK